MIPSIRHILLFFAANFLLINFFDILLLKRIDFITHVSFYDILVINILKIGMLVSVFILTSFILNLLFFRLIFKNEFKRSLLSTVKVSAGIFLGGVIFAVVVIFINEI